MGSDRSKQRRKQSQLINQLVKDLFSSELRPSYRVPIIRCAKVSVLQCSGQCDQIWRNFATLAKVKVFGKFQTVYFLFGKMLSPILQICKIVGLICIIGNGQILKNNPTIWSAADKNFCKIIVFTPSSENQLPNLCAYCRFKARSDLRNSLSKLQ